MSTKHTISQTQKSRYQGRRYCGYIARKQLIDILLPRLRASRTYFQKGHYGVINNISANKKGLDLGEDFFDKGAKLKAANILLGKHGSLDDENFIDTHYKLELESYSFAFDGYYETVYFDKFDRPIISTDPESELCGEGYTDLEFLHSLFTNKPTIRSSLNKVVNNEDVEIEENRKSLEMNFYQDLLETYQSDGSENDPIVVEDDDTTELVKRAVLNVRSRILVNSEKINENLNPCESPRQAIEIFRDEPDESDDTFVHVEIPKDESSFVEVEVPPIESDLDENQKESIDENYEEVLGFLMNRSNIQEIDEPNSSSKNEPLLSTTDGNKPPEFEESNKLEREDNLQTHDEPITDNYYERALNFLLFSKKNKNTEQVDSSTELKIKPKRLKKRQPKNLHKEAALNILRGRCKFLTLTKPKDDGLNSVKRLKKDQEFEKPKKKRFLYPKSKKALKKTKNNVSIVSLWVEDQFIGCGGDWQSVDEDDDDDEEEEDQEDQEDNFKSTRLETIKEDDDE